MSGIGKHYNNTSQGKYNKLYFTCHGISENSNSGVETLLTETSLFGRISTLRVQESSLKMEDCSNGSK